jgi:hypothetical protein
LGAWVTVTVFPATVNVPVRGLVEGLAVTATVTVPLAVPLLPLPMVNQLALLAAVQEQPVAAVTPTDAVPAVEATASVVLDKVYVHVVPA